MNTVLEEVFVTEGVPDATFVAPENFSEILVDIRDPIKPVVIEGPSGTGKTTTVKKILQKLDFGKPVVSLSGRLSSDAFKIAEICTASLPGVYLIDDFHKVSQEHRQKLADIAKLAADERDTAKFPKLILVGINQVGYSLISLAPDVAKRCGIHRIKSGSLDQTIALVEKGCEALNIQFIEPKDVYTESGGDYWLTQMLCRTACTQNGITERQTSNSKISVDWANVRLAIVKKLESSYYEPIKDFCRGRRFRPGNDPYYRILRFIANNSTESNVDLVELANANPDIAGSINNVKDGRLGTVLREKEKAGLYFFYQQETARFSVEDPAVFYFLKNLDWEKLRTDCGFRTPVTGERQYDIAISFAGENRNLARCIAEQLKELDISVFYDENHEVKYLGKKLTEEFEKVFLHNSKYVLCLLDFLHKEKMWPTFERDIFIKRVPKQEVIPIYLDDSNFVGIPEDLYGIRYSWNQEDLFWPADVDEKIVRPLFNKLSIEP